MKVVAIEYVPDTSEEQLQEMTIMLTQLREVLFQQMLALMARDSEKAFECTRQVEPLCEQIKRYLPAEKISSKDSGRWQALRRLSEECLQLQKYSTGSLECLEQYFQLLLELRRGKVVVYNDKKDVVYSKKKPLLFKV